MQLSNYQSKIFKAIFDMDPKEMKGLAPIPDVSKGIDYALSTLSEREQEILFMRYEQELTLKCIGENVGLTRSRIWSCDDRYSFCFRTVGKRKYLSPYPNGNA